MDYETILKNVEAIRREIYPLSNPYDENSRIYQRDKLTQDNISYLLSVPGLLAVEITKITGVKNVKKQIENIYNIIEQNKNTDPISLDKDLTQVIHPTMVKLFFIAHPKSVHIDHDMLEVLFFSVSRYYLLVCFLIRYLVAGEKSISLAPENIVDMINECSGDDLFERHMQFLGLYWIGLAQSMVMKKIFDYSKEIKESHLKTVSIPIGSTDLIMDQMCIKNRNKFGYIKHKDDVKNKSNSFGFALNINSFDKNHIPYNVWMMELHDDYKNINDDKLTNENLHFGYLLEDTLLESSDSLRNLVYYIFISFNKMLEAFNELTERWDSFLEEPEDYFENFEESKETRNISYQWQEALIKNRNFLDVFQNCSPLYNAIFSLPSKLSSDEMESWIAKFRKELKKHISTGNDEQLINGLNKAHEEVRIFVKIIRDINKQASILKIQDKWKNELKGSKFLKEICTLTYDEEIKAFFSEIKQNFKYLKNVENKHLETKSILNNNLNTAIKSVSRSIMSDILKALTGIKYDVPGDVILRFAGITKDYKLTKTTNKKKSINVSYEKFTQVHDKNIA